MAKPKTYRAKPKTAGKTARTTTRAAIHFHRGEHAVSTLDAADTAWWRWWCEGRPAPRPRISAQLAAHIRKQVSTAIKSAR